MTIDVISYEVVGRSKISSLYLRAGRGRIGGRDVDRRRGNLEAIAKSLKRQFGDCSSPAYKCVELDRESHMTAVCGLFKSCLMGLMAS
jgi:hypothetical protein